MHSDLWLKIGSVRSEGSSVGASVKLGSVTGSTVVHKIKPTGWEEIKRRKNVITEDMQMIRKVKKKRIQMWKKSSVEWASEEVRRVLFTRTKGIGFKKFFTHDIIVEQINVRCDTWPYTWTRPYKSRRAGCCRIFTSNLLFSPGGGRSQNHDKFYLLLWIRKDKEGCNITYLSFVILMGIMGIVLLSHVTCMRIELMSSVLLTRRSYHLS